MRGLTTIEILGLNRLPLVAERKRTAFQFKDAFVRLVNEMARGEDSTRSVAYITSLLSGSEPYTALCRQLFNALKHQLDDSGLRDRFAPVIFYPPSVITRADQREGKQALAQFQAAQEDYSLESGGVDSTAAYLRARDRRVERIQVRNLRAIANVDLPVVDHGGQAPWLMLLGENAAGKSTILHALALALVGDQYRERTVSELDIDLGSLVRKGASTGEVRIWLSGATEPRILRIHSDGRVETSGRDAQLMILAYGSTRLLPRREQPESQNPRYARIENLFDPFVPLVDAQSWLLKAAEQEFDYAAIAIKKGLSLELDRELVRQDGVVGLIEHGKLTSLSMLCDGYQTVIALIVDILSIVIPAWKTPDLAQCVVLIDEVGNHLHPSWKLRFVESMREIFPGMQVVATTHEPLCLRGLREGEIAVLKKGQRGGISLVAALPSIEGMRVDQILTSEHFGLSSTLDPQMQNLFDRYYAQLRKRKPSKADQLLSDGLRHQINALQQLGTGERERRMLDAIDRFLARRPEAETKNRLDAREVALEAELAAIWNEAADSAHSA